MLIIKIRNWEKFFRPRKNISSTQWFRLQNNFFDDPEIFELDHLQQRLWIYLLAEASKIMIGEFKFSEEICAAKLKSSAETIVEAAKILEEIGFISCRTHVARMSHACCPT